jgi:hypothetical protein
MPIRFTCSHCWKSLSVGTRKAGAAVRCPVCNGDITVPGATVVRPRAPETIQAIPPHLEPVTAASAADWRTSICKTVSVPGRLLRGRRLLVVAAGLALLVAADLVASGVFLQRNQSMPVVPGEPVVLFTSDEAMPPPTPAISSKLNLREQPPAIDEPPESVASTAPVAEPEPSFVGPPAPPPSAEEPQPVSKRVQVVLKRRLLLSDEDLRKQLLRVTEVRKETVAESGTVTVFQPRPKGKREPVSPHMTATEVVKRADLAGLPVRMGHDCQLGKEPAENMQALSRKLRELVAASIPQGGTDPRPDAGVLRQKLQEPSKGNGRRGRSNVQPHEWQQAEAIPALTQILQAENKPLRLLLVDLLDDVPGPTATAALVQRALFDLSAEVRAAAVQALAQRPREEFRSMILEGFRYPWAPVADHAAEVLVALQDTEVVPQLVSLLKERDPIGTRGAGDSKPVVRELVRINHLSNCTMCHATSTSQNDLVRGVIPIPGQALPPITTPYYGGQQGPFVRADVTYLKQDFSVPQPVERPGAWPTMQRYDYVVRTRALRADELPRKPEVTPHEALLFALGELHPAWKRLLEDGPVK